MTPIDFPESNLLLAKPESMTPDQCEPLHVTQTLDGNDLPVIVSCWKLTAEELEGLKSGKRLWLIVYGSVMPPVALTCNHPFDNEGKGGQPEQGVSNEQSD